MSLLEQLLFGWPEGTEPLQEARSVVVVSVVFAFVPVIVRVRVMLVDLDISGKSRRCWRGKSNGGRDTAQSVLMSRRRRRRRSERRRLHREAPYKYL